MTVLLAGHLCVDLTPGLGADAPVEPGRLFAVGPLRVSLGGSVANTGRALAALGTPVRAAASIGDDALGRLARELLEAEGFDTTGVAAVAGAGTSYSVVIQPGSRDRTFWHHAGANELFLPDDLELTGVELVHLGYPPLLAALARDGGETLRRFFARAHAAGITTSLDLAVVDPASDAGRIDWAAFLRAVLPVTDLVTPSLEDLRSALGDGADAAEYAERAIGEGAGVAVVSAGEDGLVVAAGSVERLRAGGTALARVAENWADRRLRIPPAPVERIVTTNGAGDASTGGLIAGLLDALELADAAELAVRSAAAVIGGQPFPSPSRP